MPNCDGLGPKTFLRLDRSEMPIGRTFLQIMSNFLHWRNHRSEANWCVLFSEVSESIFCAFFAETWHFGKFPTLKGYISENICSTGVTLFPYNFPRGYILVEKFFRNLFPLQSRIISKNNLEINDFSPSFLPNFPHWKAISPDLLVALVYFLCIVFRKGLSYLLASNFPKLFPLKSY